MIQLKARSTSAARGSRSARWITFISLALSLLTPFLTVEIADAGLAQGVPPECEPGFVVSADGTTCVEDPNALPPDVPTETPVTPVEEPPATEELPTETEPVDVEPTAIVTEEVVTETVVADAYRLTINVLHCNDPAFDPYDPGNMQSIVDQCTSQGSGTFEVLSSIPVTSQTGSTLEFQIGQGVTIQETPTDGYGDPVAACVVYDANGNVVSQIGPGVASGGSWSLGDTGGDVHCDWYQIAPGSDSLDPVATPSAVGASRIVIQTSICPQNTVDPAMGFESVAEVCSQRLEGIAYQVSGPDGYNGSKTSTNSGTAIFDPFPVGEAVITATVPNGYNQPIVYCQSISHTNATFVPSAAEPVPVEDGRIVREVRAGHDLSCQWFNLPKATGALAIFAFNCPAGFDVSSTDANPRATCSPAANIPFELDDTVDDDTSFRLITNSVGQASIDKLPAVTYHIAQSVPNGVTSSFVWDCYATNTTSSRTDPLATGSKARFDLTEGTGVRCDWFNVTAGKVTAYMLASTCPATYDAYAYAAQYGSSALEANCREDAGPIAFTISGSNQYSERRTTGTQYPPSEASWSDAPSGTLTITAEMPDGYGRPIVFCSTRITDGNRVYWEQGFVDVGMHGTIDYAVPPDQVFSCRWFLVPGGTGYVTLTTQACPTGFDIHNASRLEFEQGCNEPITKVAFTVTSSGVAQTVAATDYFNDIGFPSVPSGDLTLAQTSSTDYETAVVYCYEMVQGRPITSKERIEVSADRTVALSLKDNGWQMCEWYLANPTSGSITVNAWTCPEPLSLGGDRADYQSRCTRPRDGVEFTVTGIASSSTQTTANGGKAEWTDVQPGLVTITERIPEDYGEPAVFCTGPKMNRSFPVANGSIEHELLEDSYLVCDWYNIPLEKGNVSVSNWVCPGDTSPGRDYTYYSTTCTKAHTGVDFTLKHSGGTASGTTDNSGTVQWLDVPLGPFSLQEHIPHGYEEPVVFCMATSDAALAQFVRKETHNGLFNDELTPDGKLYSCHWFNLHGDPG